MTESKPSYEELENENISLKHKLKVQDEMINTIPNPLFVKDKDFKYTNCNEAFANYFGLPKSKIINANVYDIASKQLADKFNAADFKLREQAVFQKYESKVEYADGSFHDIIFHKACLINDEKEFDGIVGIMLDITERKTAERALQSSEKKYKDLNVTKDKLFSIIAHDLRSPFSSVLGFSELLITSIKNKDDTKSTKYAGLINSITKETLILLENLLFWAKSQTRQIKFAPKNINIHSIIDNVVKRSSSLAEYKGISINILNTSEIRVYADIIMIQTTLRNILSNSIKFTQEGGKIEINTISQSGKLYVSIADNGIGMSEQLISTLFNNKTNKTTTGTANEKGSGLGLILCKEFIERHYGDISATSEIEKGSVFTITLPLNFNGE